MIDFFFKKEETFLFICPDCKGFYDCDISINGLCVCLSCQEDIYYTLKDLEKKLMIEND